MTRKRERLVVVGGDAGGMSAASQALRVSKREGSTDLSVVALERDDYTSYSACGIPYWVAGDVDGPDALIARSPEQHRERGIDMRIRTEATALDLDAGEVTVWDHAASREYTLGYDQLLIATGAEPKRPPLPGIDAGGVYGVENLNDGHAVLDALEEKPKRAVVVGSGYIGLEMAEAMQSRGLDVTVVDQAEQPMGTLDPDMGALVHEAMDGMGIRTVFGAAVDGFEEDGGRVQAVVADGTSYPADLVVLGLGVKPATSLAGAAGLALGDSGGVAVDLRMMVRGTENVWSAGDCVESYDLVGRRWIHVALGTHANKQGSVAGTNIGGGYATFPGILGTAITKVCNLEIARTGLQESEARTLGRRHVTAVVEATTKAGYFPGAAPMTIKMLAESGTGRLLGAQIVGREGSAKRIDACAVALWNEMTVGDLAMADLSYAPPFSPTLDPVTVAARKAAAAL